MRHVYDLVCIGSGPAGQRAAIQAAKVGKRVAIIEKDRCVGGGCLRDGTVPSKTLREAVLVEQRRVDDDDGLSIAPRRSVSASDLLRRVERVRRAESGVVRDQLQRNGVNVIVGTGRFVDPTHVEVDTSSGHHVLETAYVLIAVGSRPALPAGIVAEGPLILCDAVLDLDRLPEHLVVIGAGVIGIEYASMFAALGVKVTIVDQRRAPLEFLDAEIRDELVHQLRQKRVELRGGESVAAVHTDDDLARVELESGKVIVGDLALFSIGRQGATDTLGLEHAGLNADERGRLSVDSSFRTSVPNIYAAGDVIGFPALAATSAEQGRRAARHMFGGDAGAMPAHFPIGIYSVPEVSMVGQTEEALTEARIPYESGLARFGESARGQIVGDEHGLLKLLFHRDTRKLLGAHIVGTNAAELIHTGQAVLALGGGLDYFLDTVFNYPTFAECYKAAALNAANKLSFAERRRSA